MIVELPEKLEAAVKIRANAEAFLRLATFVGSLSAL